jgi:hypothetical protein
MRMSMAATAMFLATAGTAMANPGELGAGSGDAGPDPGAAALSVLPAAPACALRNGMCLSSGAPSTVAVASEPVALATETTRGSRSTPVVPRFARAGAAEGAGNEAGPWTLTLSANLKKPAWAGNALFLFFDLEDPASIENRQFTALYQANLKAGAKVAARVALSHDEGFRAGHSYRIRVIQLINNKEVVLTEGDVSLQ